MLKLETVRYRKNTSEYLKIEEDILLFYLKAYLEEMGNYPTFIVRTLRVVAKAKNMSQLARNTSLTHEDLYKALSEKDNVAFATVAKIEKALGYQLTIQPSL